MKRIAIDRAKERLEVARSCLVGLSASNDFLSARKNWVSFLLASNRVFTLLEQGAKDTQVSNKWFDRHRRRRRKDPLLVYVHQARNADEHEVSHITSLARAKIEFVTNGRPTATLENVARQHGKLIGTLRTADGKEWNGADVTELRMHPDRPALVPVTNRGVTYAPPKEHLSIPLPDDHPYTVAKLMVEYLASMVAEAEALQTS